MCGNSGRREALITFFSLEKVSNNEIFLSKGRPPVERLDYYRKRIFS